MRDDASLRRLGEMEIDVYVLRGARSARDRGRAAPLPASRPRARVALLAPDGSRERAWLAHVARSLAHAHIEATEASSIDERGIGGIAGLVVFGEPLARDAGAAVAAARRESMGWVAAPAVEEIARGAASKRALWSELKRLIHAIGGATAASR